MPDRTTEPAAARPLSLGEIRRQIETLQVAERLFDSAILFALLDLGVFRLLAEAPRDFAGLASAVDGDAETLRALLDAAVAVGVLERREALYQAPPALATCLGEPEAPASLVDWVSFLHTLSGPLLAFSDAVRGGESRPALFEETGEDNPALRSMTRAMDAYARSRGLEMVERLDFSQDRTLLDIGCGPGTYSLAVLERVPGLVATLLDFEIPIAEARQRAAERGLSDRVELVVGDALEFRAARGFDTVLISNTLHSLGPERSRRLLERCFDLVDPAGRLLVQAQYLDDDRVSPRWPALLNLMVRVTTPVGRNHSIGETRQWMEDAGFVAIEHVRFSAWNTNSVLVGYRPDRG